MAARTAETPMGCRVSREPSTPKATAGSARTRRPKLGGCDRASATSQASNGRHRPRRPEKNAQRLFSMFLDSKTVSGELKN